MHSAVLILALQFVWLVYKNLLSGLGPRRLLQPLGVYAALLAPQLFFAALFHFAIPASVAPPWSTACTMRACCMLNCTHGVSCAPRSCASRCFARPAHPVLSLHFFSRFHFFRPAPTFICTRLFATFMTLWYRCVALLCLCGCPLHFLRVRSSFALGTACALARSLCPSVVMHLQRKCTTANSECLEPFCGFTRYGDRLSAMPRLALSTH